MDWNQLVKRESARVEWKENVANPQNVVKTLCAFANDFQQVGGGRVLCGLKEEKNESGEPVAVVVGLDEKRFKEIKNKVLEYCHRYVDPPLTPEVNEYPVKHDNSRRILVFAVTSSQYPHRYRTKKEDVNYYIRVNDETRPADGLIPQLLERKKVWPPYLDQTHPGATVDDIDLMALKEFLGKKQLPQPVEKYLEPDIQFRGDVECLVTHPPGGSDQVVPRNFTLLLFGREPHRFFRGAYAIFSVYKGKDKTSERSQRFVLFGPIPALIRNLMARLQLYMGMDIDKTQSFLSGKTNRWRFSEQAVQEAIVNAFVHRDYHSHEPVRVTVFEDKINVASPGGPYGSIKLEDIRKGEIFTAWRNPSLAWFMVELEYAQNEGQGILAIVRLTKETAGKEPEFNISNHWFRVSIPAYNPLLVNLKQEIPLKTQETTDIEITIDLPAIQFDFSELRRILGETDPALKEELNRIEDSLDELSADADKEKLKKPFNKLGRLLRKLGDENSDINKTLKDTQKGIELAKKIAGTYNKFAQWLALPQAPPGPGK
jgi:ATP-dependent DNA helicase RecG